MSNKKIGDQHIDNLSNWGLVLKSSNFLFYGSLLGCKHVLVIWVEISLQSDRFYREKKQKKTKRKENKLVL
jgi:hypothetical protein